MGITLWYRLRKYVWLDGMKGFCWLDGSLQRIVWRQVTGFRPDEAGLNVGSLGVQAGDWLPWSLSPLLSWSPSPGCQHASVSLRGLFLCFCQSVHFPNSTHARVCRLVITSWITAPYLPTLKSYYYSWTHYLAGQLLWGEKNRCLL